MALTPNEILQLSETVELLYSQIVDELLVNMAHHFKGDKTLPLEDWEIRKLSEVDSLTRESAEIIARLAKKAPDEIEAALLEAAKKSLTGVDSDLKKAIAKGVLPSIEDLQPGVTGNVLQRLQSLASQSVDKMNLVNTTMLESTIAQYRKIIANTANIERQMVAAQGALNTAAGQVVAGTATRQDAINRALMQIQKEGITGFIDSAGRKWSPDAYVAMDVRTTVHNTAIEAVKIRAQEYGCNIFRVSRHNGARPLCFPYQGRYFSWDNTSGTFEDGEGNRHRYSPLSSTSYGEPAGLFGINCGHSPITMIPGVSIPRDRDAQDYEENKKTYAESQQQRSIERQVRYAKQKAAMMDAAGDAEGFEKEAVKIGRLEQEYRAFCKKTGRTPRLDRTEVFGYNKNINSKATAARKLAKLKEKMMATGALPKGAKIHFTPTEINVQSLAFDDNHINTERDHKVTERDAKSYIQNARFSVSVWNGDYERFYSADGAAYVDMEKQLIRTAYSISQYDDETKKMMEVFLNANAR